MHEPIYMQKKKKKKEYPDRAAEGQTEFETQYAQRRKRQRLTKQLESQGRHIPEPGQSKEWPPESSSTGNLRAMKDQPRLFCIGRNTTTSHTPTSTHTQSNT